MTDDDLLWAMQKTAEPIEMRFEIWTRAKEAYTPCLKKLCKIVSVRTSSNFHQFW